jgi:hypothetical protein
VNVTFVPTVTGTITGMLVVSSTNGGNPVSLQLAGIGFDFGLTVLGSGSATVVQGQTAYYPLSVTPLGGGSGSNFNFQCANLPANSFCVFNPPQLAVPPANVAGNVSLGIGTGAPTVALAREKHGRGGVALLVCGMLGLPLIAKRRKLWLRLLLPTLMLAGASVGVSSCAASGGSGGQLHLGGGTTPGSYTVMVTASANGVSHSRSVTLVVN